MKLPLRAKLLIAFVFTFSSLSAQSNIWSLQRCLEYAKEHNIQIQQQQLEKNRAKIGLKQSQLSQLPQINCSANYGRNFVRSIDPTTNQFVGNTLTSAGAGLHASVTLFNLSQIRNTI